MPTLQQNVHIINIPPVCANPDETSQKLKKKKQKKIKKKKKKGKEREKKESEYITCIELHKMNNIRLVLWAKWRSTRA